MEKKHTRLTLREAIGPLKHIEDALSGDNGILIYNQIRENLSEQDKKFLPEIKEDQRRLYLDEGWKLLSCLVAVLASPQGENYFEELKKFIRSECYDQKIPDFVKKESNIISESLESDEFSYSVIKEHYRSVGEIARSTEMTLFEEEEVKISQQL